MLTSFNNCSVSIFWITKLYWIQINHYLLKFLQFSRDIGFLSSIWYKTIRKGNLWVLFLSGSVVQGYFLSSLFVLKVLIWSFLSGWPREELFIHRGRIATCMGDLASNFVLVVKKTIYLRILFFSLCALKTVYGSRPWPQGRNGGLSWNSWLPLLLYLLTLERDWHVMFTLFSCLFDALILGETKSIWKKVTEVISISR